MLYEHSCGHPLIQKCTSISNLKMQQLTQYPLPEYQVVVLISLSFTLSDKKSYHPLNSALRSFNSTYSSWGTGPFPALKKKQTLNHWVKQNIYEFKILQQRLRSSYMMAHLARKRNVQVLSDSRNKYIFQISIFKVFLKGLHNAMGLYRMQNTDLTEHGRDHVFALHSMNLRSGRPHISQVHRLALRVLTCRQQQHPPTETLCSLPLFVHHFLLEVIFSLAYLVPTFYRE